MDVRFYFEKPSPGLRAKLDAKYRTNKTTLRGFSAGAVHTRLETGNFIIKPVDIVQIPSSRVS
jgi:hypothetical protein